MSNDPADNSKSVKNKIRYNNQDYEVILSLYNPDGSFFPINTAALVSLVIQESSLEWYKKGVLILTNSENILERRPNEFFSQDFNYKFRNDGRDLLLVKIKPIVNRVNSYEDPFPSEFYELNYIFSIYDVEDINEGGSTKEKSIKLYFWEYDYQLFLETNADWSTNTVLYEQQPSLNGTSSQLSDDLRKIHTGDALKSLIQNVLNDRSGTQLFLDFWDPGSTKIFYASPASNSAIYDFDYIFNRHVSSDRFGGVLGDVPFIFRTRFTKRWALTSFSTLFSDAVSNNKYAGSLQREQFILASSITTGVIIPSMPHTPPDVTGSRSLNFGILSSIVDYQFVNMAAIDNTMLLKSTPCYHCDFKTKQFDADFVDNDINNIKDYYQEVYANKFQFTSKPAALFTLNKSKTEMQSFNSVYSFATTKTGRFADARNAILKSSLFLNECLSFSVLGTTYRQANVFIGLDRESGSVDADFDEKLLGQWFVTKVTHEFTPTTYKNHIVAIKPHSDKDIRINDTNVD
jgi:hypothetical protein